MASIMEFSVYQAVAITALIGLTALIKAGFGVGAGVFLAATLCLIIPPKTAIALGGPIMLLTDILPVYHYRKEINKPVLLTIMAGSLVGIVIGGLIMNWIPDRWFVKTVGLFCAVFAAQQLIKNTAAGHVPNGGQSRVSEPPARWMGFLIGIAGGAASVISHAGGVIYSIYMLRIQMAKGAFVGTIVSIFFLSDIMKIGVYWKARFLTPSMILFVGWMISAIIVGSSLGYLLHHGISTPAFDKIILAFVIVVSVRLIFLIMMAIGCCYSWVNASCHLMQLFLRVAQADQRPRTARPQSLFLVRLELAKFCAGKQESHIQTHRLHGEKFSLHLPGLQPEPFFIKRRNQDIVFCLQNDPARIPQDVLMLPCRPAQQGCHYLSGLPPAQMIFTDRFQQSILVAALQPCQFRPKARRQKPKPYALLCFIAQPLDERNPSAYPALVAANEHPNLHLAQTIFMVERMYHQRLLHAGNGSPNPIELQHGGLTRPKTHIQRANRKFGKPQLSASP